MKLIVTILTLTLLLSYPAEARKYKHHQSYNSEESVGGRPDKWCGWFMRTLFGGGPEYNVAREWKNRGRPTKPKEGAIVVWPHHVGVITGFNGNHWIVKSGNDGGRVRERARSLDGAIAFRELN